jgi:hypothetical protein
VLRQPSAPHYRDRFPAEIISHAVWLYHVFTLNEDVEYDTVLIHGTPKIILRALDPDEHLVKCHLSPAVAGGG